jgi:hypothetical protein
MKELELEEKLKLIEKEVGILGDDLEKMRLDIKEAVDLLRIEVESLKIILKEFIPDFQEKFARVRDLAMREIDPEWLTKKES